MTEDGSTTLDVAAQIGPRLQQATIAGKITIEDGYTQIIDANVPLPDGLQAGDPDCQR